MNKQVTWMHLLITNASTLLVAMIMLITTRGCNKMDVTASVIANKADIPYVKEQDAILKSEIDKNAEEHKVLRIQFNQSVTEINTNMREIRNYIYSIKK